jgi:ASC-1-like (ASCH) protein
MKLKLIKKDVVLKETQEIDKSLFTYTDSNFENWGIKSKKSPEQKMAVYELKEYATFKEMFNELGMATVTLDQVYQFAKDYNDLLSKGITFFLIEQDEQFFVACVDVYSDGLRVSVYRFEYDYVWGAGCSHRVVIPVTPANRDNPKLDLKSLESAIKTVKDAGLKVIRVKTVEEEL